MQEVVVQYRALGTAGEEKTRAAARGVQDLASASAKAGNAAVDANKRAEESQRKVDAAISNTMRRERELAAARLKTFQSAQSNLRPPADPGNTPGRTARGFAQMIDRYESGTLSRNQKAAVNRGGKLTSEAVGNSEIARLNAALEQKRQAVVQQERRQFQERIDQRRVGRQTPEHMLEANRRFQQWRNPTGDQEAQWRAAQNQQQALRVRREGIEQAQQQQAQRVQQARARDTRMADVQAQQRQIFQEQAAPGIAAARFGAAQRQRDATRQFLAQQEYAARQVVRQPAVPAYGPDITQQMRNDHEERELRARMQQRALARDPLGANDRWQARARLAGLQAGGFGGGGGFMGRHGSAIGRELSIVGSSMGLPYMGLGMGGPAAAIGVTAGAGILAYRAHEEQVMRQEGVRTATVDPTTAIRNMRMNFDFGNLAEFEKKLSNISQRWGVGMTDVANMAADALSAAGSLSETKVLSAIQAGTALFPRNNEAARAVSGGINDIAKVTEGRGQDVDPRAIAGFLVQMGRANRAVSLEETAKWGAQAIATMAGSNKNDSIGYLTRLYSTITQLSPDRTGRTSRTGGIRLSEALSEWKPDGGTNDKTGTTVDSADAERYRAAGSMQERLAVMQSSPGLQASFWESHDFEAPVKGAMQDIIAGSARYVKAMDASTRQIGELNDGLVSVYKDKIAMAESGGTARTEEMDRGLSTTIENLKLNSPQEQRKATARKFLGEGGRAGGYNAFSVWAEEHQFDFTVDEQNPELTAIERLGAAITGLKNSSDLDKDAKIKAIEALIAQLHARMDKENAPKPDPDKPGDKAPKLPSEIGTDGKLKKPELPHPDLLLAPGVRRAKRKMQLSEELSAAYKELDSPQTGEGRKAILNKRIEVLKSEIRATANHEMDMEDQGGRNAEAQRDLPGAKTEDGLDRPDTPAQKDRDAWRAQLIIENEKDKAANKSLFGGERRSVVTARIAKRDAELKHLDVADAADRRNATAPFPEKSSLSEEDRLAGEANALSPGAGPRPRSFGPQDLDGMQGVDKPFAPKTPEELARDAALEELERQSLDDSGPDKFEMEPAEQSAPKLPIPIPIPNLSTLPPDPSAVDPAAVVPKGQSAARQMWNNRMIHLPGINDTERGGLTAWSNSVSDEVLKSEGAEKINEAQGYGKDLNGKDKERIDTNEALRDWQKTTGQRQTLALENIVDRLDVLVVNSGNPVVIRPTARTMPGSNASLLSSNS